LQAWSVSWAESEALVFKWLADHMLAVFWPTIVSVRAVQRRR